MDVLMPQLGETVAEGRISTWFKSVGDAVKPGDNLFEIETDKVSMEVPSISAGVLAEIRVPAGDVAPVGAIVAVISDQAGATTARKPPQRAHHWRRKLPCRRRVRQLPPWQLQQHNIGDADRARPVPRGAHSRTQFRHGETAGRCCHDAAGASARRRGRHRSLRA